MYDNRHKTLYTIKSMERGKLYVQYKREDLQCKNRHQMNKSLYGSSYWLHGINIEIVSHV